MTVGPRTPREDYRARSLRRPNRLAVTAASFAVFALLLTVSSLSYRPGADVPTDYAAGRSGAPLPFAIVALACGIPALLRVRTPAGQDGRSWDGRQPAIVSVAVGYLVIVVVAVRITALVASR
jgi:hypothetical protein